MKSSERLFSGSVLYFSLVLLQLKDNLSLENMQNLALKHSYDLKTEG